VNECTGLSNVGTLSDAFHLYPNPNSGRFIISTDLPAQVIICNALGHVIYRKQHLGTTEINLESFSNGIYLVTIAADQQKFTRKLIKE